MIESPAAASALGGYGGSRRGPPSNQSATWRLPPIPVLLVGVILIACAEVGGASMAQWKLELARWARGIMLARPHTHGLVGVRDVDEQILDEALVKFDAGLRLFHLHAEGLGTIIIVTSMVAASVVEHAGLRRVIVVLITAGGAGYPFGYLLWSALIPFRASRAASRWPSGSSGSRSGAPRSWRSGC